MSNSYKIHYRNAQAERLAFQVTARDEREAWHEARKTLGLLDVEIPSYITIIKVEPEMKQEQILDAIRKERANQDAIWGGTSHDQEHPPEDWCAFINLQLGKVRDNPTERFIKIAALAVAAIEAEAARGAARQKDVRVAKLLAEEEDARMFEREHTDCDDPECPRHGTCEDD